MTDSTPQERGPGRPTDYKPEYCVQVLDYGRQGKSIANICEKLGISRQTWYDWQKAHPEFLDATTRARDLALSWWEDQGQAGLFAQGFNGQVWYKNMLNRFREDWFEKQGMELTGKDGGVIETSLKVEFVNSKSDPSGTA